MRSFAFFAGLLLAMPAWAQAPSPEQIMQARIASVSVNLGNLQGSLSAISDAYQQVVADNAKVRKQLADALEKCGKPCKSEAK